MHGAQQSQLGGSGINRVQAARRLHGDEGKDLQDVVLDHVSDRSDLVVVACAFDDIDLLRRRDLNTVDEVAIPDRLEEGVAEPEGQHVLHGVLAQVVIDPIDLRLVEQLCQLLVEGSGGGGIVAQGLLDYHSVAIASSNKSARAEATQNRAEYGWRSCEIEDHRTAISFAGVREAPVAVFSGVVELQPSRAAGERRAAARSGERFLNLLWSQGGPPAADPGEFWVRGRAPEGGKNLGFQKTPRAP